MDEKYELETIPHDFVGGELPESVLRFEQNYLKNHPEEKELTHNIYHLVAEDRDGNIVDEGFALNALTDTGFYWMYKESSWYYSYYDGLYLGDGDFQTIDPTSNVMVHAISSTGANMTQQTAEHSNTTWIPEMESNRVQWKLCAGWYDYTVWDVDKTVTEIGITRWGGSVNELKYHAAVYDSEGNKSSFIKKVNQKLTITVYARSYFPIVKIINTMWDRGYKGLIRTNAMFQHYSGDYWNTLTAAYYPYSWQYSGSDYYSSGSLKSYDCGEIVDHVYSTQQTIGMNLFIDQRLQSITDLIISNRKSCNHDNQYDVYWMFVHKIHTPEPIPFRFENYRSSSYKDLSLNWTYCKRCSDPDREIQGQLPFSNMHITSLTMYNGQTDDWDIPVPYLEPVPFFENGYRHLRYSIREQNWITFLNKHEWYRVFINEAPEYPIKTINECNRTMYCTDAYWDSSSWEIIPNTSNISRTQGAKRFFIMFEDSFDYSSDEWVRSYGYHYYTRSIVRYDYDDDCQKLNLNNGYGEDSVDFGIYKYQDWWRSEIYAESRHCGKAIANETLGYIAHDGFLVYPDSVDPNPQKTYYSAPTASANLPGVPYRYYIGGVDLPNTQTLTGNGNDGTYPGLIWNTTRGTHIITTGWYSSLKGCRVYTITNDPTTPPTYDDFLYDQLFTDNPGWSHSDNGYLVVSWLSGANNQNHTYVFAYDVEGEQPSMYKIEGYHHAFAIDLTNYFVAIDASVTDHLHMIVYDRANQTIHAEFDIPEGYTFQGIAGWKNFVYIRVDQAGAKSTFLYHIDQNILESTPLNLPQMIWDTYNYYSHIQRAVPANGNIESCMVLMASDRDMNLDTTYHVVFKESEPTNPITIIRKEDRETANYIRWQKCSLTYANQGKQLLLSWCGSRVITIDLGWVLKHGTHSVHYTHQDCYDKNSDQYSPVYYKGVIYLMQMYKYEYMNNYYSSRCRYWRSPVQNYVDLCIEGTTYTPSSFMNPVRIQGNIATGFLSATNRNIDTAPEPYVPPEP